VLREHYELHRFPFDSQTLHIPLQQDDNSDDLYDLTVGMVLMHRYALEQPEWTVYAPCIRRGQVPRRGHVAPMGWAGVRRKVRGDYNIHALGEAAQHDECITNICLKVSRNYAYYNCNLFGLLYMITLSSFCIFMIPPGAFQTRLGVLMTLMLTNVAFKFSLQETCPKVGYSTHVDTFVFIQIFHIFFCTVITVVENLHVVDIKSRLAHGPRVFDYFMLLAGIEYAVVNFAWLLHIYYEQAGEEALVNPLLVGGVRQNDDRDTIDWFSYAFCSAGFMTSSCRAISPVTPPQKNPAVRLGRSPPECWGSFESSR
jgi:hypothetical protein